MFTATGRVMPVLIAIVLTSTPTVAGARHTAATSVSADPLVSIVEGSPDRRQTVIDAVERFLASGLALPELEVHFHVDNTGCAGKQGLFHPSGDIAVIDLCYPGEFLALHELGHAWEHFNLDDQARSNFQKLTGATTWRSPDVVWRRRGAEQAANTLAHGLLSVPLASIQYRSLEFVWFEALTGIPTPRLAEIQPSDDPVPVPSAEQLDRAAAYYKWRQTSGAAISGRLSVTEPVAPCSSLDSNRLDCVR